jgi:hypothetical protein
MDVVVKKLLNHLKKIEAWEAKLIETDECWRGGVYPQFTRELFSGWMGLQKERNELLAASCQYEKSPCQRQLNRSRNN